jgi:protein FAM50
MSNKVLTLEGRQDALAKERDRNREEFERQKQKLISETEKARPSANRFVGQHDSVEDSLKNSTVGLVSLPAFQAKRKELEEKQARELARSNDLKCVPTVFNQNKSRSL